MEILCYIMFTIFIILMVSMALVIFFTQNQKRKVGCIQNSPAGGRFLNETLKDPAILEILDNCYNRKNEITDNEKDEVQR